MALQLCQGRLHGLELRVQLLLLDIEQSIHIIDSLAEEVMPVLESLGLHCEGTVRRVGHAGKQIVKFLPQPVVWVGKDRGIASGLLLIALSNVSWSKEI